MTKIYKFKGDISSGGLKELEKHSNISLDTEGSGLQIPHRDRLSLVQLSSGNNDAYIIQPSQQYQCPNIVKILENKIHLIPANKSYSEKIFEINQVQIQGALTGIIRKYN